MIVFYNQPNLLYLPYTDTGGASREATFVPGKNVLSVDDWESIVSSHKKDFENYYSKVLRVLKPTREIKDTEMCVGEDKIDIYKLTVNDAVDLIKNTMEIDELKAYKTSENKEKSRKCIFKEIDKQIKKISDFTEKITKK